MSPTPTPLALVVIVGPQASGKSTVAMALSQELRSQGELVALVALDQIAAMALPTLPDWQTAHHIFESVVGHWARAELTCVIAEGAGNQDEVARLLVQASTTAVVITVVVTAPFDVSFSRAQADPTRGVSRDHSFLSRRYARWPTEMARITSDVLIDTAEVSLEQSVELIRAAIGAARHDHPAAG